MTLSWSGRRQLLYAAVAAVLAAASLFALYQVFFTATPTCRDGVQNGSEAGIDCGGGCALLCPAQSRAPVVLWARAFRANSSTYTAAAYVQNQNAGAYAPEVHYTFQLFDESNLLVAERTGTMLLPPVQTIPIIEPNIEVGQRNVARTLLSFAKNPIWLRAKEGDFPALRTTGILLKEGDTGTVLNATLVNDSSYNSQAQAGAVLFDAQGAALAASRTTLSIGRKSQEPLFFTWPQGVQGAIRAEVIALPEK